MTSGGSKRSIGISTLIAERLRAARIMEAKTDLTGIRAVLFDFDGTLADSYGAIAASVNHVRSVHGLPALPETEVRRFVGHGPEYLIEHTVGRGDVAADLARYKTHHP